MLSDRYNSPGCQIGTYHRLRGRVKLNRNREAMIVKLSFNFTLTPLISTYFDPTYLLTPLIYNYFSS